MSLFSLFVDLKANTADFVSGMGRASYETKKAGREIQESCSGRAVLKCARTRTFSIA
jgi:hypothetical protein